MFWGSLFIYAHADVSVSNVTLGFYLVEMRCLMVLNACKLFNVVRLFLLCIRCRLFLSTINSFLPIDTAMNACMIFIQRFIKQLTFSEF